MEEQIQPALPKVADREALIVETLPLIRQIAQRIALRLSGTVEIPDLVNAGVIGLLDAIDKFEPAKGVKFRTYAEVRIRGAILDSLRQLDWAPRSLRRKGKKLQRVREGLNQTLGRQAADEELARALGSDLEEYHALVDQLHGLKVSSLHTGELEDSGDHIDFFPDDGSNNPQLRYETKEVARILGEAIQSLPPKERTVLSLYYFEEFTMKEIGNLLGVNESRVSQIHASATTRLRHMDYLS